MIIDYKAVTSLAWISFVKPPHQKALKYTMCIYFLIMRDIIFTERVEKIMNFFLTRLKLNGIKNIQNEIQFDFYNKILSDFNPELYRVKAIYGENGSGKTAVMTAVSIAKKIMLTPGYLKQEVNQSFLDNIINKKTRTLSMEFEFVSYTESFLDEYRYSFVLKQNEMKNYILQSEKLEKITKYTRNKKFKTVFEVYDGNIKSIDVSEELAQKIKINTMNTLHESSLSFSLLDSLVVNEEIYFSAVALLLFFLSIVVYLDEEDMHEIYLINKILNGLKKSDMEEEAKKKLSFIRKQYTYLDAKGRSIVEKNNFKNYEKKIVRLGDFLRVFKPELKDIAIEKREDINSYVCELVLNYPDYSVNQEFESTGIKKLIRLYDAFVNADEGNISFIDEMDSNLNDIYLCKIVEYFANYSKGQLCFTTHNLDPMDVIKNNKNSIDFLSSDNKVVSWKVTGNAAPDRYYRNGMIENSPFNVDAIDFIGKFGE